MTTATLTDERYLAHTDPQHFERAERLLAIYAALEASDFYASVKRLEPRAATTNELQAVHTVRHLEAVERYGLHGGGYLDPDTYMNDASWEAAVWAAGGAIRTVEAVVHGECDNAFALLRPPGHHATRARAMGFCLVNNIAVAARYAIEQLGLERVAIVDYDVHHGNGTQDIFYDDPHVLFCSTHAAPYYPGTGLIDEIGNGAGEGATLNVPLPLGVGDKGYVRVFEDVVIPALRRWQPDLLLVSAGYDSHWSDPIGPMVLSTTGYGQLTRLLYDAAAELCGGKLVLILEGGYNLDALGTCTVAALEVLLGRELSEDRLGQINAPEPDLTRLLTYVKQAHPLLRSA